MVIAYTYAPICRIWTSRELGEWVVNQEEIKKLKALLNNTDAHKEDVMKFAESIFGERP